MNVSFTLGTAVAVVLLLAAELGRIPGRRLFKMLASTGFVAVALTGAFGGYGTLILAGLALSWFGDLALTYRGRTAFLAGLGSFLAAHLVYVAAFFVRSIDPPWLTAGSLVVAAAAMLAWRWLHPHLAAAMRLPVACYIAAISSMMAAAAATFGADADARILLGAVLFYASDLFVARQRFVHPGVENRMIGLPLYFAGQLLLAWSAGG